MSINATTSSVAEMSPKTEETIQYRRTPWENARSAPMRRGW